MGLFSGLNSVLVIRRVKNISGKVANEVQYFDEAKKAIFAMNLFGMLWEVHQINQNMTNSGILQVAETMVSHNEKLFDYDVLGAAPGLLVGAYLLGLHTNYEKFNFDLHTECTNISSFFGDIIRYIDSKKFADNLNVNLINDECKNLLSNIVEIHRILDLKYNSKTTPLRNGN
ncbi:hypothetical protein HQ393_10050 [Chitinibacter bivalviorum]|uniref:Uncharacterized protein n=1 Tax=Chitinibacter bivalviorum TaxID=2739434 RepID=A0A7H9BJS4_9NEIS|nr:hypothetical protein [Chitinibacter bivalviorum]QLG88556.1 hypothetical protein HQ393_10050 [Chitinibacter bivalviorum]